MTEANPDSNAWDDMPAILVAPNPFLSEVQWPPPECPQCAFVGRHQTWCMFSPEQAWWAAR